MGFIEDITSWWWNITVWSHVMAAQMGCWKAGGWGLVFNDDDGTMMKKCFDLWDGMAVTFPVTFESSYAEESA